MPPEIEEAVVDDTAVAVDDVEQIEDVLPPEDEKETPAVEVNDESKLTAAELREKIRKELQDEAGDVDEDEDDDEPEAVEKPVPSSGQQSSASTHFINEYLPSVRKEFSKTVTVDKETGEVSLNTEKQFDLISDMANRLVGAVMADNITPKVQKLAVANITLANRLALSELRADPEFKKYESSVIKKLNKMTWQDRAQDNAVEGIYHKLRGAKSSVKEIEKPVKKQGTATAGAVLKDIAAGGGAAPKPAGIRLTKEQEQDYQEMVENGWTGDRKDYYAKYKSRVDRAKAQGHSVPKTYRG